MNWEQLIERRDKWIAHNFPDPKLDEPMDESVVGVIEEVGELAHAHLKAAQNIRGSNEKHIEDARDAIGDCTVYLLGIMSGLDKVPEQIKASSVPTPTWALKNLAYQAGMLALNPSQYLCERIVEYLEAYCDFQGWDYEEIVTSTWDEVEKRDWIKYPDSGLPNPSSEPGEYIRVVGE